MQTMYPYILLSNVSIHMICIHSYDMHTKLSKYMYLCGLYSVCDGGIHYIDRVPQVVYMHTDSSAQI